MRQCPKCQATTVHHWTPKTPWQRLRRRFTRKALFRCAACGYMFFAKEHRHRRTEAVAVPPPTPSGIAPPDLEQLDAALEQARANRKKG